MNYQEKTYLVGGIWRGAGDQRDGIGEGGRLYLP